MALLREAIDGYRDLMENKADPRVNDWFLMSSPWPTMLITFCYVYFAKILGPKLMEGRKPFKLKEVLILYNLFEVVFSAWMFYQFLTSGWLNHYNFRCQPVEVSNIPRALSMARVCWWFYFSKFIEFFDTILFVLRKKNEHISTLHVYHHGIMPLSVWIFVKFFPGGHLTFGGLLNSFVHVIMYSYYLFAALGPRFQKFLWWKKYLTVIQMVQFVVGTAHAMQLLFTDCNYPKFLIWYIVFNGFAFYGLFNNFYKQAYKRTKMEKCAVAGAKSDSEERPDSNTTTGKEKNGDARVRHRFN